MNDKVNFEKNTDHDDLTVIDATIEESRVNVVDSTLGDDDYSGDDFYDEFYDEKVDEPYYVAIKSVVFGSLAIVFPLFAWLFAMINRMSFIAFIVSAIGLCFGLIGFVAHKRCSSAPRGSLSQGLARAGRCISIIGLVVSSAVIAIRVINFVLFILAVITAFILFVLAAIIILALTVIIGTTVCLTLAAVVVIILLFLL